MSTETTTDGESSDGDVELPGDATATDRSLAEYLQWVLFAVLVLVLLMSTLQFYTSLGQVIDTFVQRRYQPVVRAAVNLAIVLACGFGLSILVRRMT